MAGIIDDIKNAFRQNDNALNQLILINVIVFVFLAILKVLSFFTGLEEVFGFVYKQFSIPPIGIDFIKRPWTIISYSFAHSLSGIFHILFNMLVLYWFGRLISEYLGSPKVVNLYILGALAGGLLYLLFYNAVPVFAERASQVSGMVGASAAVYAIMVAAAVLLPDYTFHLIFIGPVKIKWIVAFYIFLSFLGSTGDNAGGNIAHLGGALIGWVYIRQLQAGNDWGKPIQSILDFFRGMFDDKPKIKVTYKQKETKRKAGKVKSGGTEDLDQDEIDAILDKIADRGYESLTKEEKQKLFNASQK
ncbi:MAG: rhomboid family intramembrane serine protease [Cytophagales bacterium]